MVTTLHLMDHTCHYFGFDIPKQVVQGWHILQLEGTFQNEGRESPFADLPECAK
jgi:hypothetical protein